MEDQLSTLAVTHLLQHTLRSLCIHDNSQWVYAVFWRILPRNYPPPKWDLHGTGGAYDRSRGNRRNWILVWEDGFCNFAAASTGENTVPTVDSSTMYGDYHPAYQGLQPEVFFKMSHEIYNYGEGLIGKVAADHSHKWIHKEANEQEINFLTAWQNSSDSQPRAWEAQFQSGIKTIALIAVREGVLQLGGLHKVIEDLSYVVSLRKKLSYIGSIPGVLLPHPSSHSSPSSSSSPFLYRPDSSMSSPPEAATWHQHHHLQANHINIAANQEAEFFHVNNSNDNNSNIQAMAMMRITPSMSSLEALLSKLPSVVPLGAEVGTSYKCHGSQPPAHVVPLGAEVGTSYKCHEPQPPAHVVPLGAEVGTSYKCHEPQPPAHDASVFNESQRPAHDATVFNSLKREEEDDGDQYNMRLEGEEMMGLETNTISSCLSSYDHLNFRHDDNFGYHFRHYNINNNGTNETTHTHRSHHHDLNVTRSNNRFFF